MSRNHYTWPRLLALSVGLLCVLLIASDVIAQTDILDGLARQAKTTGQKEVVIKIGSDYSDANGSEDEYLSTKSVVMATPARAPVVVRRESLMTVRVFRINQVLRSGAVTENCSPGSKAHGLKIRPGAEIAVAIAGGEIDIDGIRVVVKAFDNVSFEEGVSVLLVGWNCGNSTLELMHGDRDIFDIKHGNQPTFRGLEAFPFVTKFNQLGTIAAITSYLKTLR